MLNIINLTYGLSNLVAWGNNALLLHVEGLGFHSCRLRLFSFFVVVSLCFVSLKKKHIGSDSKPKKALTHFLI